MKLGGVLLFRLCFEKGVWLLVSSFSFDAATAIKIGGSQNETKLDFYSRISEGTFQPPENLLLRLLLCHFRHEIRWCFTVSAVFRKRCLATGFLLY